MSKHHAVREDIKLRIAEVRDDVMKEPTLSVGEKKEVRERESVCLRACVCVGESVCEGEGESVRGVCERVCKYPVSISSTPSLTTLYCTMSNLIF